MDPLSLAKTLHSLEVRLLLAFGDGEIFDAEKVRQELSFREGQENQAFSWLQGKGLLDEAGRTPVVLYEITALGISYAKAGTPEERMFAFAGKERGLSLPQLAEALGFDQKTAGSAFGLLSKAGCLALDENKCVVLRDGAKLPESVIMLGRLLKKAEPVGALLETDVMGDELAVLQTVAKKRGAQDAPFRLSERERVQYRFNSSAAEVRSAVKSLGITGQELGALTSAMLEKGAWKGASFRPYNIGVAPARAMPGRKNPYVEFLESVKDKLVSLGFEEFDGNMVETEFWNSDALFMPQFHSARDIHDVYHIESPSMARSIEEPHLSRVAAAHENGGDTGSRGWSYSFDRDFTRRLILRSQGTVLSARQLPKARVPGKYFGIVRCFRYDKVDATHLSDFYQTEGIVLGEEVNLRTLLGFLEMFAVEVAGATEVKYVPGYFPFTEPSVEVHIKHPVLGWFELGGSGIFRPEVTKSLGVNVPVLAWGIGIDRMALMALGLNDLRELFSPDLENVRLRRTTARIR